MDVDRNLHLRWQDWKLKYLEIESPFNFNLSQAIHFISDQVFDEAFNEAQAGAAIELLTGRTRWGRFCYALSIMKTRKARRERFSSSTEGPETPVT